MNNKTPELDQAKKAIFKYLKDHQLDPEDTNKILKDPVHGPKLRELILRLNIERDKALRNRPKNDLKGIIKHTKYKFKKEMAKKELKKAKKAAKEAEVKAAEKEGKVVKATKYDYPLVDGREMTSDEKKKYRMEQRKKAKGTEVKSDKAKAEKAPKAKDTKDKKPAKAEKAPKKEAEKPSKDKKKKSLKPKDED